MIFLATQIVCCLILAFFLGSATGWFIKSRQCKKCHLDLKSINNKYVSLKIADNVIDNHDEDQNSIQKPMLFKTAISGQSDDLAKIKGITRKMEKKLNLIGVYYYSQIAAWSDEELKWIELQLAFPNIILNEEWVNQAKQLLNIAKKNHYSYNQLTSGLQ